MNESLHRYNCMAIQQVLPKLVLIVERIELSTQSNLRVRCQVLSHHRLHGSEHIHRGPIGKIAMTEFICLTSFEKEKIDK